MGGHYGSIHVRAEGSDEVISAISKLAEQGKQRFLVAPAIDGWVSIFPNENGQDSEICEQLAPLLPDREFIQCIVHDDNVFEYWYYQCGSLKDRYNSWPTYFDEQSTEPRGGDAKALVHLLAKPGTVSKLQMLLDQEPDFPELDRLDEFAKLLGIPNGIAAYEYLQQGDCGRIRQWRKFVHVPDLAGEKAAKKAAAAKVRAEMKQLKKEGVLLADLVGAKSAKRRSGRDEAGWTINPATSEVLLYWAGDRNDLTPTPLWRINPSTQEQRPSGIELISGGIRSKVVSKSGKWLGVCASGRVRVFDLKTGKLYAEMPAISHNSRIYFSADERFLFSAQEREITVVALADMQKIGAVEFKERIYNLAVHPDGDVLMVSDYEGILSVVDLQTFKVAKHSWVKNGSEYFSKAVWEQVAGKRVTANKWAVLKARMPETELEMHKKEFGKDYLPVDRVLSMVFSRDGKWLACITVEGLCVIEWAEVMACPEMASLNCGFFVEAEEIAIKFGSIHDFKQKRTLAAIFDEARNRVLFSGVEGKVRYLELTNGEWGDLLGPPERIPFFHLELTADRSAVIVTAQAFTADDPLPAHLQMWSYSALCRKVGIPF